MCVIILNRKKRKDHAQLEGVQSIKGKQEGVVQVMIQKNSLVERIENIDYTHLLGYPAEVVAVEVKTMAKEIASDYMEKVVKQLESELYRGMESLDTVRISFNFGINKAIEIVKKGGVVDENSIV